MRIRLWGTRGSLAAPGQATAQYGGNTSCVQVQGNHGQVLVLDAGTGIRALGASWPDAMRRVDILLTHLHLDHIQGLGFFAPLFEADMEVHLWGPRSTTLDLRNRLMRYLSPPLFPVRLRDLPCQLVLHEVPVGRVTVGEFEVFSALVCHPGPTVGYRIQNTASTVSYLPDHEPALAAGPWHLGVDWISGYEIAQGADLLIHDAQYTDAEYADRIGWGHSSVTHAFKFATCARVKHFMPFHHDPTHDDDTLDQMMETALRHFRPTFQVTPAKEGVVLELS